MPLNSLIDLEEEKHISGFVNIIGRPNVGKSTLMNALVGEKMSIITHKPQTTRHRILGILSGEAFQVVFSDTPGYVRDPIYEMHEAMNRFVFSTFEDADLMLFVTDVIEEYVPDDPVIEKLKQIEIPLFLVINKTDLADNEKVREIKDKWTGLIEFTQVFEIAALHRANTQELLTAILDHLPPGPAYYPKDQLTDRPERFFVSEIIREKILLQYREEIPYSCEVIVTHFKEEESRSGPMIHIEAVIFVMRKTQKGIMIGHKGSKIKQLGIESRKDIEAFLGKKVFLQLRVKVRDNWRDDEQQLKHFGYKQ